MTNDRLRTCTLSIQSVREKDQHVGWRWYTYIDGGEKGFAQSGPFRRRLDCMADAIQCNPEFANHPWQKDRRIVLTENADE